MSSGTNSRMNARLNMDTGSGIDTLSTPAMLLDLDILEENIRTYAEKAKACGKALWPMVKTHKSSEIAAMQADAGCEGFLCGTLDEAEQLAADGFQHLMYAYPAAAGPSIQRIIALAKQVPDFIVRLDSLEAAEALEAAAAAEASALAAAKAAENREAAAGKAVFQVKYTVILDCGLHRFGISAEKIAEFVEKLRIFPHLLWKGISTHPGHVYGAASAAEVPGFCAEEAEQIGAAVRNLKAAGLVPEIVGSGSTPTYAANIGDPVINMYHPGNYVFNDAIQISNGTAEEGNCALTVLATVISNPSEGHFICDAGAKCLGLDQGAHGNSSLTGHGRVIGHPELKVSHLSEEVGQLEAAGPTDLKIGDRIRIIPNHSCSAANLTSRMTGIRRGQTDRVILVNMRGNQ